MTIDRLLLQKAHPGVQLRGVPAYLRSSGTFPAHDTIPTLLHSYRPYADHFRVSAEERFSSRHFDQLNDLFLFTTEIRYEFGQDNVVADALPRMKIIASRRRRGTNSSGLEHYTTARKSLPTSSSSTATNLPENLCRTY